jgi:pilus assembly protein CpaE
MMPLNAAFVISNRTVWEQAHACIRNLPVRIAVEQAIDETTPIEADALLDRIERHRVDVVLVESSRLSLPLEEFVRRLRNMSASPAVIVLNPDASPERILEALRAGANEYLHLPLADTLRDAFERLSETRSKGGHDSSNALGKAFGFLSARGGCGATTFVVHVANSLARQIKETMPKQPMLVADFDFDAGLLRFLLKSKSPYSVRDALDNLHRMDASLWKGLVSPYRERFDVIPAPEELAAKVHPGQDEMMHLMRFMRSMYPVSIVDFGRSVSMAALDSLPELDALYLVVTCDTTTVDHAKRAIQMVEDRGFESDRLKILLNRAPDRGSQDPKGIESILGRPSAGVFRNDFTSLYDAYSEGRFLQPANALGKGFEALAESIRARAAGEREKGKAPSAAAPARNGTKRWFSFLQSPLAIHIPRTG